MTTAVEAPNLTLGPGIRRIAVAAVVVGLAALLLGFVTGMATATFAALAASWLFAAGMAAGTVAVSAAVHLARGRRWIGLTPAIADSATAFFGPAFILLVVIVLGGRFWMPRAALPSPLSVVLFVVRNLVATALLFAVGWRYMIHARRGIAAAGAWAVAYLLLYAIT